MSSLPDKDFEEKLDRLLSESVQPSAKPSGLVISVPPRRPRFNWKLISLSGLVFVLISTGLLMVVLQGGAVFTVAGQEFGNWVQTALIRLFSPEMLVYTGLSVAGIYYFLFTRVARLLRFT